MRQISSQSKQRFNTNENLKFDNENDVIKIFDGTSGNYKQLFGFILIAMKSKFYKFLNELFCVEI